MIRRTIALLLLAAGTLAAQEEGAFRFTFDWPAPGAVKVTERRVKKSQEAEMTYVLRIAADEAGGGRVVSFEDFAFKTVNGMDASRPELQRALGQAAAMAKHIPTIRCDGRGDFVEFIGFDDTLDAIVRSLVEDGGLDEAKAADMRRMLDQPKFRQLLVAKSQETWNVWVGLWNDPEFTVGSVATTEGVFSLPGTEVTLPVRFEATCKEVTEAGGTRRARVSIVDSLSAEGEVVQKYLRELLLASGVENPPAALARFGRNTTIEGVFEVETLRPFEIEFRQTIEGGLDDGSIPLRQFEERSWRFEWE